MLVFFPWRGSATCRVSSSTLYSSSPTTHATQLSFVPNGPHIFCLPSWTALVCPLLAKAVLIGFLLPLLFKSLCVPLLPALTTYFVVVRLCCGVVFGGASVSEVFLNSSWLFAILLMCVSQASACWASCNVFLSWPRHAPTVGWTFWTIERDEGRLRRQDHVRKTPMDGHAICSGDGCQPQ